MIPPLFLASNMTWAHPGASSPVLSSLDFQIRPGEVTAICGKSGSGKTTLLQLLAGFWEKKPSSGLLVYRGDGGETFDYVHGKQDSLRAMRSGFGYVLQNHIVFSHLPTWVNITLPLLWAGHSHRECWQKAKAIAAILDDHDGTGGFHTISANIDRPGGQLSTGQKQRIGILRSIAADPLVVFADEPTSNLDKVTAESAFRLLRNWKEGTIPKVSNSSRTFPRSLIVVNHNQQQMEETVFLPVTNRLVLGDNSNGKVDYQGQKDEA